MKKYDGAYSNVLSARAGTKNQNRKRSYGYKTDKLDQMVDNLEMSRKQNSLFGLNQTQLDIEKEN